VYCNLPIGVSCVRSQGPSVRRRIRRPSLSPAANLRRLADVRANTNPRPVEMDMGMSRQRPFSVSQGEYPFQDHWFERDGVAMHYVDEGSGTPVLMLHGNSTWSYLYRHVIKELAGTCRCIAPDYPGFGFSEHPPGVVAAAYDVLPNSSPSCFIHNTS